MATKSVKLPSGVTTTQPFMLSIPPQWIVDDGNVPSTGCTTTNVGSASNPHGCLMLPAWMKNSTYVSTFQSTAGYWYNTMTYGAGFRTAMVQLIQSAGAHFVGALAPDVVRIYAGYIGEPAPNMPKHGEGFPKPFLTSAETPTSASCSDYTGFIRAIAEAAEDAFPGIPVVLLIAQTPCADYLAQQWRNDIFTTWSAAGRHIGAGDASLAMDHGNAGQYQGNRLYGWNLYDIGNKVNALQAPVYFEMADNPGGASTAYAGDNWRALYWSALVAAGAEGDILGISGQWVPYYTDELWDVVDYWLASDNRLAVVFRDREYPTYNWTDWGWGNDYGWSGYIGDFNKNGYLLTPTAYPQACAPLLATAAAQHNALAAPTPIFYRANRESPCPRRRPRCRPPHRAPLPTTASGCLTGRRGHWMPTACWGLPLQPPGRSTALPTRSH